jgi:16S rRNA A1518/A1519 N6-dimethyltransferase RsmA/KsgA/DIM1 with predicted DNA glycosylase/AP lyase activity
MGKLYEKIWRFCEFAFSQRYKSMPNNNTDVYQFLNSLIADV